MSNIRKGTLAKTFEWAKHLRPYGKRRQAKAERKAGQKLIRSEKSES